MPMTASNEMPKFADLVPHSGDMVLLDRVVEKTNDTISCALCLQPESRFVREGRVRPLVGLEYMAQAVAAYAGWSDLVDGDNPEIGFLIGVRNFVSTTPWLSCDTHYLVEAKHVWGSDRLGSFETRITHEGAPIIEAKMTLYRGELPEEGLQP